ncbi:MAG TPA: protein-L-isoaspartate(D-aspartate) O-methyltransferase [Patescibacteria group bacterium]|nr:protein-L-isoaspartate(D-aspartate) O-methyltransferase [Patescibacteria group bacterium]
MAEQSRFIVARDALIEQIKRVYDIRPQVLEAVRSVPRHRFVLPKDRDLAYEDTAIPIGYDQTISQPSLVAYMTNALDLTGDERVLEIGTGSGYQAAILGKLAKEVVTIERIKPLADRARKTLQRLGFANIVVHHGDGTLGFPDRALYDAIMVTAAFEKVPPALVKQLKEGGTLVMPVGGRGLQTLMKAKKVKGELVQTELLPVQFVPLIGEAGYKDVSGREEA